MNMIISTELAAVELINWWIDELMNWIDSLQAGASFMKLNEKEKEMSQSANRVGGKTKDKRKTLTAPKPRIN